MSCHLWQQQQVCSFRFQEKGKHGVKVCALNDFSCWYLVKHGMSPVFLAGAKTDGWNASFAHPVRGIGREDPFTSSCRAAIAACKSSFPCLHIGMIFRQGPGRKDFLDRKDKAGIAWFSVHGYDDLS